MFTHEDIELQDYMRALDLHITELAAQAAIPIQLITPPLSYIEPLMRRAPVCEHVTHSRAQ